MNLFVKKVIFRCWSIFIRLIKSFFGFVDLFIPKRSNYWVFPSYFIGSGGFCDNSLAVFDEIKYDKEIKKILLLNNTTERFDGENVVTCKVNSLVGLYYLLVAKVIFVQHSFWLDYSSSLLSIRRGSKRDIINLWHGVSIKDISHKNTGIINKYSKVEMPNYFVISSSYVDCQNMKKAFKYTEADKFWITGLPRNDFLIKDKEELPEKYQKDLNFLEKLKKEDSFILYAPTYRELGSEGQYEFNDLELNQLEEFLLDNKYKLLLRYHAYRKPISYQRLLSLKNVFEIDDSTVSDVRTIIRVSDLVITDYSSLYVDALYCNKACISFAYDYDNYMSQQRGFFYNFIDIFPGHICKDFDGLLHEMGSYKENKSSYKNVKDKLFQFEDANNARRVVDAVKAIGLDNV
ncbi:CDP-glycerol glycerophosphotransferase family protein [Vibrio breoganii]|uniref:CDP-glycerol glycerophosphotransferase family protein n=1 Tax=Vibrio breoganii TaxID=553239 RepID=UPI0002DA62DA|nr:CDP-glycerol glycerophosphotransferase family protein [Vibrio breoganii]OED89078.1 hypothetical protein A1QE_07070 [Vibrio breoganii ZF-55]